MNSRTFFAAFSLTATFTAISITPTTLRDYTLTKFSNVENALSVKQKDAMRKSDKSHCAASIKRIPQQAGGDEVAGTEITLLAEDFSKFTAGSEENPDKTDLGSADGTVDASYFQTPGWGSYGGMFQAGGKAYFDWYYEPYYGYYDLGYIWSPTVDATNEMTLTFKAKSTLAQGDDVVIEYKYQSATEAGTLELMYVTVDNTWKEYSCVLPSNEYNTYFLLYPTGGSIFIDDIEITAFVPKLAAPIAKPFTHYKGTEFTANWQPVSEASKYLLTVYDEDNSVMLDRKELTETSCKVTGLDVNKRYYYYVEAQNDNYLSPKSKVIEVNSLMAPTALAATVADNGFTATWEAVARANRYDFWAYRIHKSHGKETVAVAESDFSEIVSEGTPESPEVPSAMMTTVESLPGWTFYVPIYANGAIGVFNSYALMGYPTLLESPTYDLSDANGKITIDVDLYTADAVAFYLLNEQEDGTLVIADRHDIEAGALSGWQNQKVTLSNGSAQSSVIIEGNGYSYLLIDNLKATVDLPEGGQILIPIQNTVTDKLSADVAADMSANNRYAFKVRAAKVDASGEESTIVGSFSDLKIVENEGAVRNATTNHTAAFMTDGRLNIVNPNNAPVAIFNANGVQISTSNAPAIELPQRGIYIVKIGMEVFKVIK